MMVMMIVVMMIRMVLHLRRLAGPTVSTTTVVSTTKSFLSVHVGLREPGNMYTVVSTPRPCSRLADLSACPRLRLPGLYTKVRHSNRRHRSFWHLYSNSIATYERNCLL